MSTAATHQNSTLHSDAEWNALVHRLPDNLDDSAFFYEALIRKRNITCAAHLLRLIFAYATGLSLDAVRGWAAAVGVAHLSKVGLEKRLQRAQAWLCHLIAQVLLQRTTLAEGLPLRVRLVDATHVQRPGRTLDRRLHLGMDLRRLRLDHIEVTGTKQGESLCRFPVAAGELAIGDRGLASRPGLWAIHQHEAWVLVRVPWDTLPLQTPAGQRCHFPTLLRPLALGETRETAVTTVPTQKIPAIPGRLITYRLTAEELTRARTTQKRKDRKRYRKDRPTQPQREGIELCAYLVLFTTLPAAYATTAQILALYRLRWQIELLIKRLKSVLHLDEVQATGDALTLTTVYAKLLLALLCEDLCQTAEVFSP